MTRILSLFVVFMLTGALAFSQSRVVTGKVIDVDGNAVPFATIKVKGTTSGQSADANGSYSIRVKNGDALVVSGTGFKQAEFPVGTGNALNVNLERNKELVEIVVTSAFQTKRTLRSQSSNVQQVTGEQLNTVRASDINNGLAGKVAGAQVRSQSAAKLGSAAVVRLRGENGLGAGTGPIYVVDGTIITNSSDVNTDDVESMTILQGPASAALFGPDGANGAIVVTTKRAKKNSTAIEVNTGITFDKAYILQDFQNSYAGGSNSDLIKYTYAPGQPIEWKALDGKFYHNYDDDASWGPRLNGQEYIPWYAWYGGHDRSYKTASLTPQPNNIRNYWETGVTRTKNVSFSKATDNMNLRVSYTNLDIKGLVPNSYLKKNTLNMGVSIDVTPKLTVSSNITYINQKRNSESDDGYSNSTSGSFNQWFHRELDMGIMKELKDLRSPQGVLGAWNVSNPDTYDPAHPENFYKGNYWFNPYTYFDYVKSFDNRDRLFGDLALTYKINSNLKVKGTYRRQQVNADGYNIYPTEFEQSGTQISFNPYGETSAEGSLASYQTSQEFAVRQNYEGLISFNKKIKNFGININTGFDILKSSRRVFAANTSGGLSLPGVYSLANSVKEIRNSSVTLGSKQLETITEFRRRGIFVSGDLGYKNFAFIEGSYRRDFSSAEPQGNFIDTKSIGASFIFSDFIKDKSILSYGKIRASYGQILNTLNAYDLGTYYVISGGVGANPTQSEPNSLVDPKLRGSANSEKELGIEMRFLKNRVGITGTYYDRTNKDFPVLITTSGTTGYTGIRTNAGELKKTGIELQFFAQPFKLDNFTWDFNTVYAKYLKNEIVSIAADGSIKRLTSGGGAFSPNTGGSTRAAYTVSEVGQKWGQLHGTGIKRINGVPVVKADGTYESEQDVNYGSILPDYTGGFQNTFTIFKNFVLNVNIDYSYGGKYFSLSDYWGSVSGLTAKTASLNDRGNSIRDAVADGGGVHVVGVDATNKPVDMYIDAKTYYNQYPSSNISENSVYDLTFVKLRELSLGYKIPMTNLGIGKFFKYATVSIISRNPFLIYAKTRDFDPSEIANVAGEDGQFPGTRSLGINVKLGF
jgi:TonB-linked SusC/RagA family outer membrane protein